MRQFEIYQKLPGDAMDSRDHQQATSKFWGRGKWENYVASYLPADCTGLSLVDIGCNAGLFLKFAQDRGFSRIIGVDSNKDAVRRGLKWASEYGGKYTIIESSMETAIDKLPIVDYTLLVNVAYYFRIEDWIDYLDKLQLKTRYVIIVTTKKDHINHCWTKSDVPTIRRYFSKWKEVGFVDELPTVGDSDPRRLWSLCFESPVIKKIDPNKLENHNHVQDNFYKQMDEGLKPEETGYYRILKKYRNHWTPEYLAQWVKDKVALYKSIKEEGQFKPVIVDHKDSILDGNHKSRMLAHLGYKEIFIRQI